MRQDAPQAGTLTHTQTQKLTAPEQSVMRARSSMLTLTRALQATASAPQLSRKLLIIRPETRRTTDALSGHDYLSRRARHIVILCIAALALMGTVGTLVPLASGQSAWYLPGGLNALMLNARTGIQSVMAQNPAQNPATTTNLSPMAIPTSQLVTQAQQDATAAGISPVYFVRQINLESGFNPNAVSPAGAEGIAQFEPATAAGLGIDPFNPTQALQAAAQMMARYALQYGSYPKALAAYNAGPVALTNAENACGTNWLSCMAPETQHYVATITGA